MKVRGRRLGLRAALLLLLVLAAAGALISLQFRVNALSGAELDTGRRYRYHFAMVADNDEAPFWQLVHEGAQRRAEELDAYVELIGGSLTKSFGVADQLQIAAYAGVDGIFVVPDGEEDTNQTIGRVVQASSSPIPVLTLMENDSNSGRSGYVGINHYEQGIAYGQLIASLASEKEIHSVALLANAARGEDQKGGYSGDVIYSSLMEYLSRGGLDESITVSVRPINHQNVFACERDIKQLFHGGEVPDVLICPDYRFTVGAAQVLVDQNLVGRVSLLGASLSRDILEYVSKGTIAAVVTIDPYRLGRVSVDEMIELMQSGRTNDYTALETILIDRHNVADFAQAYAEGL